MALTSLKVLKKTKEDGTTLINVPVQGRFYFYN